MLVQPRVRAGLAKMCKSYDSTLSEAKLLRLEIKTDEPFLVATASVVSSGLKLIWESLRIKKRTTIYTMRAELESAISIKRRSRLRKFREAGDIIENMIDNNFLLYLLLKYRYERKKVIVVKS